MTMHNAARPEWIFLDIGGTLLEIYRPMAEVMHEYLLRAGQARPLEPIKQAVREAVSSLPTPHPSFTCLRSNREWWMTLYETALHSATDGTVPRSVLDTVRDAVWEQHRRGDNLRPYADAEGLLDRLRADGFRLGVISNWDDTLPPILERYGMLPAFEFLVVSTDLGIEKPSPEIFTHALERAGIDPRGCLHVGDDWRCDVIGAAQLGIRSVWIERGLRSVVVQSAQPDESRLAVEPIKIKSLRDLPDVLARVR